MEKTPHAIPIPSEQIENSIFLLRGQRVILDAELATMYGVTTKNLVKAVKRNQERFPNDFMFQLNDEEFKILRFQFGTSNLWGGRRYPPHAFTEQGVAMLSSVLRGPRAAMVNVAIMRAFVKLRKLLQTHADLARKLEELEGKYDRQFRVVFDAIRELMNPPPPPSKGRLGFQPPGVSSTKVKAKRRR